VGYRIVVDEGGADQNSIDEEGLGISGVEEYQISDLVMVLSMTRSGMAARPHLCQ
jgi:hypothetical protein